MMHEIKAYHENKNWKLEKNKAKPPTTWCKITLTHYKPSQGKMHLIYHEKPE